jgi:hypothetical protein
MSEHITVEMSGEKHELEPTLHAAKTINAFRGGFAAVLRSIQDGDMAAVSAVVAAGMGMKKSDEYDRVEESIFKEGVSKFIAPSANFVIRLMNGGRDPEAEATAAKKPGDKESPKPKAIPEA